MLTAVMDVTVAIACAIVMLAHMWSVHGPLLMHAMASFASCTTRCYFRFAPVMMGGLGQAAAASCEAHDDEEYVTEEVWAERLAARRLRTGILMMEIWHRHNRTWYFHETQTHQAQPSPNADGYRTDEVWAERLAARRIRTAILMMEIWHTHNRTWYPETKRQAQSFLTLSDEANSSG